MTKHAKNSACLQAVDQPTTIAVEVPLQLLGAFANIEKSFFWKGRIPAGGQATPMTYPTAGRQYVVIAAGGVERAGTSTGDHLVAFALPRRQ